MGPEPGDLLPTLAKSLPAVVGLERIGSALRMTEGVMLRCLRIGPVPPFAAAIAAMSPAGYIGCSNACLCEGADIEAANSSL